MKYNVEGKLKKKIKKMIKKKCESNWIQKSNEIKYLRMKLKKT
jgi:hypothetical protein